MGLVGILAGLTLLMWLAYRGGASCLWPRYPRSSPPPRANRPPTDADIMGGRHGP
jgi:hypothetical protein